MRNTENYRTPNRQPKARSRALLAVCLCLALTLGLSRQASAADNLRWNAGSGRVSADIHQGDLLDTLERITAATGWQVFVEPDVRQTVSAKFTGVPPGEALRLLLGDLSFALVPGTNATSAARLFVFRTSRENATQLVRSSKPPAATPLTNAIPNELIVRLKPGAKIDDLARLLGAKVVGRIDGLNAYRLQFDDATATTSARQQLANNSDVASVDSNYVIDQPEAPGVVAGGAPSLRLQLKPPPETGRVVVGLIDTAVQPLGDNLDQFLQKSISVAGQAQPGLNSPTHGTAMAETILRSLQDITHGSTAVQILPVDVYGPNANTSTFDVASGIVQAVNAGARIINLSLGNSTDSPFLRDVIQGAAQQNILFFAAAGNQPVTTPFYPAAYPEVNAVTAVERGQLAPYASRGSFVSLGAPGSNIIPFGNQAYGIQGTSVSSAAISGGAAGYMDMNQATTQAARTFIRNNFGITIAPGP